MPRQPNYLSGGEFDRATHLRLETAWLESQWTRTDALTLPVWRSKHLLSEEETPRVLTIPAARVRELVREGAPWVLLGTRGETARFAIDLSDLEKPTDAVQAWGGRFQSLREVGALLPRTDGALLAYAGAMIHWHRSHRFCGACGHPTEQGQGGHVRQCTAETCAAIHFPRTDPAVIMLVTDGERCLLGRQARWAPGVYSSLAGFVEPGESLEDAVRREVCEETGILVERVRYHSSQPWPFPSSLMLGFTARATTREIRLLDGELEDARWFSRQDIENEKAIKLPTPISIARRLIEDWLSRG